MEKIVKSSGNIFTDLGFPQTEAVNLKLRSQLMIELEKYIHEKRLTQAKAAKLLDIKQSRVSDLVRGKVERFSIDMLITLLSKIGYNVDIHVHT